MATIPENGIVAIIGGGPVGLLCSILLSMNDIPHYLFERHPSTAIHPKAVGLNQRTTEIFAKCSVLEAVYAASAPACRISHTAWYTSLGPSGREIVSRNAWGSGPYAEAYEKASPYRYVLCPQIRLEPILLARARELNPEGIFYGHEVIEVAETTDCASLKVLNRSSSTTSTLDAEYVLACDGGRSIASSLSIPWHGESSIIDMVAAHFRAPISQVHPDNRNFITWFINPELGGSINTGYLYHLGPYDSSIPGGTAPDTEEWNFACAILPHEEKKFTEEDMLKRMHAVLQIPDLKPEILSLSHWFVNATTVAQYHSPHRRVFLVGDAAHKMPPWGALGLNTGIQDADNICWKLAWAIKHTESAWQGLLESYDTERRPIAERNSANSLHNLRSHGDVLDRALGISPAKPIVENVQAMEEYFAPGSDIGASKREAVSKAMEILDLEFYAHGNEVGWFYASMDLNHEGVENKQGGQVREDGGFEARVYQASTIPGHHLPHAWLKGADGTRISTRGLVRRDKMVLLTEDGLWRHFEHDHVDLFLVDEKKGLRTADGAWEDVKGVGPKGALLVRPDGIVAWRWQDESFLLEPELKQRTETLLDRIFRRT